MVVFGAGDFQDHVPGLPGERVGRRAAPDNAVRFTFVQFVSQRIA
ncbi:MAG: hypothetical protein OXG54_08270 [Gammaproteobacteria bacterium]|nr:hypothetical protein [Gammaproteobacteria bacterium]